MKGFRRPQSAWQRRKHTEANWRKEEGQPAASQCLASDAFACFTSQNTGLMVWLWCRRFVCNESVWKTIRMRVSDRSAFLPAIRLLQGLTVPARDTPREVRMESCTEPTGVSRQGVFLIDAPLPPQACSSHPLTTKSTSMETTVFNCISTENNVETTWVLKYRACLILSLCRSVSA